MDSPGDIQVASSWTSPRPANSTGAVNSRSSPISYYSNLTINLQDTELDSGGYAVTFSIISLSSFLIGDIVNGSRDISVEGKSFFCALYSYLYFSIEKNISVFFIMYITSHVPGQHKWRASWPS